MNESSIITQMRGAGGKRMTRWPNDLYRFVAARQFGISGGQYGIACNYTGSWLSLSKDISLGLQRGSTADYNGHLDHADPNSCTLDNTAFNLQFLEDWVNGTHFKHDKVTPYSLYIRARLGNVTDWPYVAQLIRLTYESEGYLLCGWPLCLTATDGSPVFPGYDENTKTFAEPFKCIIDEHRHYLLNVIQFLDYCTKAEIKNQVYNYWMQFFAPDMPLSQKYYTIGS